MRFENRRLKIAEYEVDGTLREKECDKNAPISHLTTIPPDNKVYRVSRVIEKIEKQKDKFWSYVYENGKIIEKTKIAVEPIHDKQKGDYVRTHRDGVEENNLLELPIYYKENKYYKKCKLKLKIGIT